MKDIFSTTWMRWSVGALAAIVIFLLAFGIGVSVGYEKGIFASRWGRNYEANFLGPRGGMIFGMPGGDAHGAAGTVISVASSTFAIKDDEGNEQSIAVASGTIIRKMNSTISLGDLKVGDEAIVIGSPDQNGQVRARFIRVFPSPGPGTGPDMPPPALP